MSYASFRVVEALGKGSFASVYKVQRKTDQKIYALKRVKVAKMCRKELEDALNEIRLLASLRHKNVVGFLEAFLEAQDSELCIVMEYCGCGDLAQKVERYKRRKTYIEENVIWRYLIQCLKALSYLHSRGVMHRDIKAANTFLAEDGSIKLGDMNVSKRFSQGQQLHTQIGTPYYMSPEIWNNRPYDASADLWALGCMIYELAALRPPFSGNTFPELKRAVLGGRYQAIPGKFSSSLTKVIGQMLRLAPSERPSAAALLQSADLQAKLQLDEVPTVVPVTKAPLMDTIKVPLNGVRRLAPNLPKPCYPDARPNSPSAWTVAEQQQQQQQHQQQRMRAQQEEVAPPPPPPAPVTLAAPALVPTAAAAPGRRVPAPPPVANPGTAAGGPTYVAGPLLSQLPGYNRVARYAPSTAAGPNGLPTGYAGAAAGYPSRVLNKRIW